MGQNTEEEEKKKILHTKIMKILRRERKDIIQEGIERRQTSTRQPRRNSIDRETRVYIFRGELNCSQNALVTETSEI